MRAVHLDHIHPFSSAIGACDGERGGLAVDEREAIVERKPRSMNFQHREKESASGSEK